MSNKSCIRCSKEFKFPYLLKKHLERKYPCKVVEIGNDTKMIPNDTKMIPNDTKMIPVNWTKNENKNINIHKCKFCKQEFKNIRSLYRHNNEIRCKKIPETEIKKIKAFRNNKVLNKKIEKEIVQINNNKTINTNCNNNTMTNSHNTTYNIKINPFGKENLESITPNEKVRILNRAFMAFPEALKKIHFDIPENRNFFNTDKKDKKYIQVFNGKNIIYEDKEKIKDDISYGIMGHLETWFDEYQRRFNSIRKELISKMFKEFNNGRLEDKVVNDIEKFILSYSNNIKELLQKQILELKRDELKNKNKKLKKK